MGAWGTGIFDDDITCDVRDEFIELLEEGLSVKEATKIILNEYIEEFNLEDDLEVMSLVYIGLAATQMEYNCLQEEVRKKTIELIDRAEDLELWEGTEVDDYAERKKVLNELKLQLINCKS
jgi:hypothetical protein